MTDAPRHTRALVRPPLLVSMLPYLSAARLAGAIGAAGLRPEAVCERDNALAHEASLARWRPLGPLRGASVGPFGASYAIAAAIRQASPAIVIPCDDQALWTLQRLHRSTPDRRIRSLIERSLGDPGVFELVARKSAQQAAVRALGVRAPRTLTISSPRELDAALAEVGGRGVLKRDRTWAGHGVAIVNSPGEARAGWERLARAHTVRAAAAMWRTEGLRNAVTEIHAARPTIQLQAFVEGRPANWAVFCRNGAVSAAAGVVALETATPTGPATRVAPIEHEEMESVARRLVRAWGLTGFIGLDFILEPSGRASFLEMNARATPIVSSIHASDLIAALAEDLRPDPSRLRGSPSLVPSWSL